MIRRLACGATNQETECINDHEADLFAVESLGHTGASEKRFHGALCGPGLIEKDLDVTYSVCAGCSSITRPLAKLLRESRECYERAWLAMTEISAWIETVIPGGTQFEESCSQSRSHGVDHWPSLIRLVGSLSDRPDGDRRVELRARNALGVTMIKRVLPPVRPEDGDEPSPITAPTD